MSRGLPCPHDDRRVLRGRCRPDGPRHRPGPRRDRAPVDAVRARPGAGRGRPRPDRRQPRPGRRQGPARRGRRATTILARIARDRRPRRACTTPTSSIEAVFEDVDVKTGAVARARPAGAGAARSSPRTRARSRSTGSPRPSAPAPPIAVRRDALLQPGPGHAARRADPRPRRRPTPPRRRSASWPAELGKQVIVSADRPGFIVNRILMPFLAEAMRAFEEGLGTADDIDTGARIGLNHPMGPLELADFIGLDVCLGVMRVLDEGSAASSSAPPQVLRGAGRRRAPRPEDRPRLPHLSAAGARDGAASRCDVRPMSRRPRPPRSACSRTTAREFAPRELAPDAPSSATRPSATTARCSPGWASSG